MIISNNKIRKFLSLPEKDYKFDICKVDSVGVSNHCLMFINHPGMDIEYLDCKSLNSVVLVDERYYTSYESKNRRNDFISVSNPKYIFCILVTEFNLKSRLQREFEYINGERTVYIDDFCYTKELIIGDNVSIDTGAIIGGEDFSPVLTPDNKLIQFPQLGGVMIGSDVTIKYNTMIGKGTFGYTQIGDNTMIDFGCQIGHNCIIGKSCIIAAGTIIGGSTVVGDHTVIGIGAKIRNGITIGNNVSIGMGSVVIHDVPDNCVVVGNPARIIEHDHIFSERGLV